MVLIDKLTWCSHDGNPIYSIHTQPNSTRFVTGGSDSRVKVWNATAATDARKENNPAVPKLLSTITDHNGPVNVVRFSNSGKLLASGSDDRMACIYELRPGAGGGVLGGDAPNVENWRTRNVLRGHANNIVDLTWSPDDSRLVTVGLETRILVWDVATGHCIKTLEGHSSFVKGVAWDPVGTYVATLSEDHSVIIWRADDWSVVASIKAPFHRMVTSTFACRLSWAPDGRFLLAGNSYQGTTHSAVIIPREGWDRKEDFLLVNGHMGAVVAPVFNPKLFHLPRPQSEGGGFAEGLSFFFALGSQDRYVTIWNATAPRALFGSRLFKAQATDASWTPDGSCLMVSSGDGTVGTIQLDATEIGKAASAEEVREVMTTLYGAAGAIGKGGRRVLVESAMQMQLEESLEQNIPGSGSKSARPVTAAARPPVPSRPAPLATTAAATQRALVPRPAGASAALDARLGGGMAENATTQVGFGGGATTATSPLVARTAAGAIEPTPDANKQLAKRARLTVGGATPAQPRITVPGFSPGHVLAPPPARGELHVNLGRAPQLLGGSTSLHELRASNKERGGVSECHVECKKGGQVAWKDVIPGKASTAAGTLKFSAVGTVHGDVVLYSVAGRRLAPPLKLGAGIAVLAAASSWRLLVVTTAGSIRLIDVEALKSLMQTSLVPLLEDGGSILDVKLSKNGAPLVTLSDARAFAWNERLSSWMCVADETLGASRFAPLLGLAGQGELGDLQASALTSAAPGALQRWGASASASQRVASRAHLEGSLSAALVLGSAEEYKRALVAYARILAEDGDSGRLEELCDDLLGGPAVAEGWEDTVLGFKKRDLLRNEVLREMARNRGLGGLLQRVSTALDDIEAIST